MSVSLSVPEADWSSVKRSFGCNSELKMASHGSYLGGGTSVGAAVDEYVTPGGYELEKILNRGSVAYTHVNEVWPSVYIGDE